MKITKFGHACLFLEKNDQTLVIDPGCFTELPRELPANIVAVVVTEEHVDHFDQKNLEKILAINPSAKIYTTQAVADALSDTNYEIHIVSGRQEAELAGFALKFNETDHAVVYKTPPCKSLALQVDNDVYYPSDSYLPTSNPVQLLALPVSGPWFKLSEAIDFANQIDCQKILATHNGLNSEFGDIVTTSHLKSNLKPAKTIVLLQTGEQLTL